MEAFMNAEPGNTVPAPDRSGRAAPAVDSVLGGPPSDDTSRSSGGLSRRATDFGLAAAEDGPDPLLGCELGEFVVERLIAQGGMGRVYLARQRSPARAVAIKVLRPGRRSPIVLRRFAREAELLARLQHPGIAQVFTAGSSVIDGEETPFFVMEHVTAAEPLVRACDRRGLDVRHRLELFLDVCQAVAHGHAAGVVHRDLKPGNILVGADGRPKVIDFGIARIEEDDAAGLTETGGFVGTRQYGSPEQCDGGSVDQRSDVYSLGVILHELLTGRLPHDLAGKTLSETARIIRETPPARLRIADRSLARPVEALAATCLAKRPAARYGSAGELAADVGRLLAGQPIAARPPGPLAAAIGWCRRHRTLAASLAAALASAAAVMATLSRPAIDRRPAGVREAAVDPPAVGQGVGPTARFAAISSLRTTPLQWLPVAFDEPVQTLSVADFRLTRNGSDVPLSGVTVTGAREKWEIRGLERVTSAGGRYVLELAGTPSSPVDLAGRLLAEPAEVSWRMPPFREVAFNLLGDDWRKHVVALDGVRFHAEQDAGKAVFFQPTEPGKEGSIVLRFEIPFAVQAASLTAAIAVWTTGDPFPYDPGARAAIDVSRDGTTWITLETREANRGGFGGGPFEITEIVSGGRELWVRARLTATRAWPEDGLIHAQFLRSDAQHPDDRPFRLTLTGRDPDVRPPPPGTPPADG
jgi:predicted Ser/Thr protein kinase